MAEINLQIVDNNNESSIRTVTSNYSDSINDALQNVRNARDIYSTVRNRTIGYSRNTIHRLRDEFLNDIHGMQNVLVTSYTKGQIANDQLLRSLHQNIGQDHLLCSNTVAIQCVDKIQAHHDHLQSLPATTDSLRERSSTIESMQSQLSLLVERVNIVNPRSPLKNLLKIFQNAFQAMNYLINSVIKTIFHDHTQE